MKLSENIKSISHLKAHTTEILDQLNETGGLIVITRHGKARAVLQDIAVFEQTQESLAMLKMMVQRTSSMQAGRYRTAEKSFSVIRDQIAGKN